MLAKAAEVSVVVPCYCEAENLRVLVPRIAAALGAAALSGEIIIVDDDSPDGTESVCTELAQRFPLRLITRYNERGLSSAVICGLRAAAGQILVVMDADLSHPPEAIPEMVAACRKPLVDFVIGSRHAVGGSISQTWSVFRRLNSSVATLLARGLTAARDPMSGFFALQRSTFESASDVCPIGYKIGLELIVRCDCRQIVEVPIHFEDRVAGESKLTMMQQWHYLRHLARLYWAKYAMPTRSTRREIAAESADSAARSPMEVSHEHQPAA
jgi:dolichol-phosphate mannosyltransferase